jgi:hypothetical protein
MSYYLQARGVLIWVVSVDHWDEEERPEEAAGEGLEDWVGLDSVGEAALEVGEALAGEGEVGGCSCKP